MPDTFCSVWIHYVFSTKNREPWVVPAVRARLWPYFAAIAKQCHSMPKCITAPFSPTRDGADLKSYETGAEAPAYFQSASGTRVCSRRLAALGDAGVRRAVNDIVPSRDAPSLNSGRGRGRARHNVGRASSPVRLPKTAWKNVQTPESRSESGSGRN
jgi:hypothetical protein